MGIFRRDSHAMNENRANLRKTPANLRKIRDIDKRVSPSPTKKKIKSSNHHPARPLPCPCGCVSLCDPSLRPLGERQGRQFLRFTCISQIAGLYKIYKNTKFYTQHPKPPADWPITGSVHGQVGRGNHWSRKNPYRTMGWC